MIYISRLPGIISRPNFSPLSLSTIACVTSWLTVSLNFLNWYLVSTEGSWEYLEGQPGTCEKTQLGVGVVVCHLVSTSYQV